jgi:hypothetical protein
MAIACLKKTHRAYFSGADPNEVRTLNLVLFTEYKRNGQLFRAHSSVHILYITVVIPGMIGLCIDTKKAHKT